MKPDDSRTIGSRGDSERGPTTGELPPGMLVGVVETALAEALALAARAGRWEIVGQLARELEQRRAARSGFDRRDELLSLEPRGTRKGEAG